MVYGGCVGGNLWWGVGEGVGWLCGRGRCEGEN